LIPGLYIHDEQTGAFWSPTPFPAPGGTPYIIRHGFGYSVYEHAEEGIISELTVYVAMDWRVQHWWHAPKDRGVRIQARKKYQAGFELAMAFCWRARACSAATVPAHAEAPGLAFSERDARALQLMAGLIGAAMS